MSKEDSLNASEVSGSWFSRLIEGELKDDMEYDQRVGGTAIFVFGVLGALFFVAHQTWSTGFFTATFGALEMLLLYGYLIAVMVSGTLYGLLGRKHLSRLFDVFGGLLFSAVSITWLLVVFPFEFAHFADVLPDFLRFLVQWISNDIGRVLMVLLIIFLLAGEVFMTLMHVGVRRARAQVKTHL